MIEGTTVTQNYGSTISYFTPKTMTLKEILKSWLDENLGEGFRFKFDDGYHHQRGCWQLAVRKLRTQDVSG